MEISQERLDEFKRIYKEEYDEELTDVEAYEKGSNLLQLMQSIYSISPEQQRREKLLKKNPKGFQIDVENPESPYSCMICHSRFHVYVPGWYDRYGPKCMPCQNALWDGIVPWFVYADHKSWYSMYDMENTFRASNPKVVNNLLREGLLKAIVIPGNKYPVFLKKDNRHLHGFEICHRLPTEDCRCPDPDCHDCHISVCLNKDCIVHILEKKKPIRTATIELVQKDLEEWTMKEQEEKDRECQRQCRVKMREMKGMIEILKESLLTDK